ncbi:MAG: general secretion pathway protein M [Lentisphaeria bacterium]|jgi:general secretion pathway protein M
MTAFKEWWAQASTRDQIALLFCAIAVALYLLFFVVLGSMQGKLDAELTKSAAQRAALERVRGLAAQVIAQKAGGAASAASKVKIESLVQQSLTPNNLQVASMSASGNTGVRLRFDDARFENILKWLHQMESSHELRIKDLSVAIGSTPGTVTVNLRMDQE